MTASGDADKVEARLRETLDAHGLQLFARIDHAAGARKGDLELEPTVLLIFGNASVGSPLMQADPRVGIEFPLRMLIWQDPDGTHVGYLDPASWPTVMPSTATIRRLSGRPRCSRSWPPRRPAESLHNGPRRGLRVACASVPETYAPRAFASTSVSNRGRG